jgi:hypothetical protein
LGTFIGFLRRPCASHQDDEDAGNRVAAVISAIHQVFEFLIHISCNFS